MVDGSLCIGGSLEYVYNISDNVAMATLSGETVAAKRRGKNSYTVEPPNKGHFGDNL